MQSPAEDDFASLRSGLGQSVTATKGILDQGWDKAKGLAGQANQAMVNRGVTPLGAAAMTAGGIGAAMLLKHLLTQKEPEYGYR